MSKIFLFAGLMAFIYGLAKWTIPVVIITCIAGGLWIINKIMINREVDDFGNF